MSEYKDNYDYVEILNHRQQNVYEGVTESRSQTHQ